MKKPVKKEDVKNLITSRKLITDHSETITDNFGNVFNIEEMIEQADKDLESKQPANLNLRWNKRQIERLKRIAKRRGQKYQTFIKSVLEQIIESEEKRLDIG